MPRAGVAALALIVLALEVSGCTDGGEQPNSKGTPAAGVTKAVTPETDEVHRTLNFSGRGRRGNVVMKIPYGEDDGELSFIPTCTPPDLCEPPCPCEVPLVPAAFDIDEAGRAWVLDHGEARAAVFAPNGWAFNVPLGPLGYRTFDLQALDNGILVDFQDGSFHAGIMELSGSDRQGTPPIRRIRYEGRPIELGGPMDVVGDRLFAVAFTGEFADEERFVELVVPPNGTIQAVDAEGWAVDDHSTLVYPDYVENTVSLSMTSLEDPWSVSIPLHLRAVTDGRLAARKGAVSWGRIGIDNTGEIHLLLIGGTFGRQKLEGMWYLKVGADGSVGRPVKLRNPERDDEGQQTRHLTLDAEGTPHALFLDEEGVTIESLEPLEELSLPPP